MKTNPKLEKRSAPVAVAPKITAATAEWYKTTWPSLNAGVTIAIEMLPRLHAEAIAELRGKFSRGELAMILDVMNGHAGVMVLGGSMSVGYHIPPNIEDSFRIYPGMYEEKWEITDAAGFVKRLNGVTRFHLVALEIWSAAFWEKHYETVGLDDYCRPLLA